MFIRRTQTRNRISGEPYSTYRLVETSRVGGAVKQSTLLNLGSHFDLPKQEWPALAMHIDELLQGQKSLLDATLFRQGPSPGASLCRTLTSALVAEQALVQVSCLYSGRCVAM